MADVILFLIAAGAFSAFGWYLWRRRKARQDRVTGPGGGFRVHDRDENER